MERIIDHQLTDELATLPMIHIVGEEDEIPTLAIKRTFYAPDASTIIKKVIRASEDGHVVVYIFAVYYKSVGDRRMYFVDMGYNSTPGAERVW